ncbi:PREDICTED: transcription elongation factor A protein-like 1 [Elephantulus edwardii]|uniref:transcription elongation factor A protein-like 1 n=1 Tax=Elephantulus edwardii TaxID=28737 RepID=UPI0003F07FA2|nr:PREDICTED: transcription elongation factor A protein-like 1 [Elephantulus edwardii]
MEKPSKEKEPQGSPENPEEPPPVRPSPKNHSPEKEKEEEEELSSEEPSSSEEEFFPQELLLEMLLQEARLPEEHLSTKHLFEERSPREQPPCGVEKHKLEEGSFKERLALSSPQFRGAIHGKNLSNEEMIKVAEEMEEMMKRVKNKLLIMYWKAKPNRPLPCLAHSSLSSLLPDG